MKFQLKNSTNNNELSRKDEIFEELNQIITNGNEKLAFMNENNLKLLT